MDGMASPPAFTTISTIRPISSFQYINSSRASWACTSNRCLSHRRDESFLRGSVSSTFAKSSKLFVRHNSLQFSSPRAQQQTRSLSTRTRAGHGETAGQGAPCGGLPRVMGREAAALSTGKRPFSVVSSGLAGRGSAAFEIDVNQVCEVVAPLPKQVRERWAESRTEEAQRDAASLEDITARLESARRRREEFQRWVMLKQARSSPRKPNQEELRAVKAKKLEEKLATAEQNRLSSLEAVRLKAAAMHQRTEVVAERVNERQDELAQKLLGTLQAAETRRLALQEAEKERLSAAHQLVFSRLMQIQQKIVKERESVKEGIVAKMVQADALREARLAAAAAKAGSKVRHAKHVSKMRRLNEERYSEMKRLVLDSKLQTAADRRREGFTVRAAVNAEKSETQFLKRQAMTREKLRRQGSSRRLQQFWRTFRDSSCTTHRIARAFVDQGVTFLEPEPSVKEFEDSGAEASADTEPAVMVGGPTAKVETGWNDPFEEFASRLQSKATIHAAKKLLSRFETRLTVKAGGAHECTALLRRLFPKTAKSGKIERYPTRVFLCAYMILNHPEVVFNRRGEREEYLSSAAKDMIDAFERVIERVIIPGCSASMYSSGNESSGGYEPLHGISSNSEWEMKAGDHGDRRTVGGLLMEFDSLWVSYLEQFVAWKSHDAAGLESELIRMAVELETSMLRKCNGDPQSPRVQQNSDLQAVVQQVAHDHELLRERIQRLTRQGGVHRLEMALMHARDIFQSEATSFVSETEESESDSSSSRSHGRRRHNRSTQKPNMDDFSSGAQPSKQGNEALLWELLYDPGWQFPVQAPEEELKLIADMKDDDISQGPLLPESAGLSVAEMGEVLQREVQKIAEKAYWDALEQKLASQAGVADEQLLNMLVEIGVDLAEVLPKTAADEVREMFEKSALEQQLLSGPGEKGLGGFDTNGLLQMIEHTSNLLRRYGAPARDELGQQCHETVQAEIMESLSESGPAKSAKLAKSVARAVRLLIAQLKILRLDVANVRLKILADSMPLAAAVKYIQDRFCTIFCLDSKTPEVGLPKTKEWLQEVQQSHSEFASLLHGILDGHEVAHTSQVPTNMQAGIQPPTSRHAGVRPANLMDNSILSTPIEIDGWQFYVRIGLAQVISGEKPALSDNLPESLQLDAQRLHKAQDTFQKLLVMSAALLVLQEHKRRVGDPAMEADEIRKVRERLSVVLSDPLMKLPSLTTELAQLAGSPTKETEDSMQTALMGLIASGPNNNGFKSLSKGLCRAIVILLTAGPGNKSSHILSAVQNVLGRIGAAPIMDDVIALCEGLARIARVSDTVYSLWYSELWKNISLA